MKKLILILALASFGLTAHSQVLITILLGDKLNSDGLEFGLEGGVNWATISGLETNNYASRFNLGFYFDIRIKNQWSLYTGVLVKSNLGVGELTTNDLTKLSTPYTVDINGAILDGDYQQKSSYFIIPILAKYQFKNQIYAELGPQIGLMHKAWIEYTNDNDDTDVRIKHDNKDDLNTLDAGITIGAGYQLLKGKGWTIGAKYYYGLVDVYKDVSGTKNSSFFLKVNIPVGTAKPSKSEVPKG